MRRNGVVACPVEDAFASLRAGARLETLSVAVDVAKDQERAYVSPSCLIAVVLLMWAAVTDGADAGRPRIRPPLQRQRPQRVGRYKTATSAPGRPMGRSLSCIKRGGGWLRTTKMYSDFVLRVDYRIPPEGTAASACVSTQGRSGSRGNGNSNPRRRCRRLQKDAPRPRPTHGGDLLPGTGQTGGREAGRRVEQLRNHLLGTARQSRAERPGGERRRSSTSSPRGRAATWPFPSAQDRICRASES